MITYKDITFCSRKDCKAYSWRCRNHGGCGVCEGNRLYQTNKELERMEEQKNVYQQEETQGND